MTIEHFRVGHIGHAGAGIRHGPAAGSKREPEPEPAPEPALEIRAETSDASCATGAFYTSPVLGASVDALQPVSITWSPALNCLLPAPSLVDIYLTAPGLASPQVHAWTGVPYASGNYTTDLMPRWWGAQSGEAVHLQVMVVPSGIPPYLSVIPAGPVFVATYTTPTNGTVPAAADSSLAADDTPETVVTATNLAGVSSHKLSKGKTAAAVIMPLLVVLLLGLAYLKITRARGKAKRSEWSEKLDRRMSTISADWKAVTAGGAREAVRQSIAASRASAEAARSGWFNFSFGAVKTPTSANINSGGGEVSMGEKPLPLPRGSIEISERDTPRTSLGSGVGVGVGARRPRVGDTMDRASRTVSFADQAHPRPSMGSAYSRGSRAFHTSSTYATEGDDQSPVVPPVPALPSPSRISAYGGERTSAYFGGRDSVYSGMDVPAVPSNNKPNPIYTNPAAWSTLSSGVNVEGVDGGYGASSVSPTGRVHTINYPSASALGAKRQESYDTSSPSSATIMQEGGGKNSFEAAYSYQDASREVAQDQGSYFSPVTPSGYSFPTHVEEPSAESAYGRTTFDAPAPAATPQVATPAELVASPRQTAGPLNLTAEDIRRRMAANASGGEGGWRQSVDEVFGALSMMRTGSTGSDLGADDENDGGEFLFAPAQSETVFQYPGTPAASSFNSTAPASPFAMPMSAPSASPDDMLRQYAKKRTSNAPAPLQGAQVVGSLRDTGMRVLYDTDGSSASSVSGAPSAYSSAPSSYAAPMRVQQLSGVNMRSGSEEPKPRGLKKMSSFIKNKGEGRR